MKEIGMLNVTIAHLFNVHRNLVARCAKGHSIILKSRTNQTDNQIKEVLNDALLLNSNLGECYALGILFTNCVQIHQTRMRHILRKMKYNRNNNVRTSISRRICISREANAV